MVHHVLSLAASQPAVEVMSDYSVVIGRISPLLISVLRSVSAGLGGCAPRLDSCFYSNAHCNKLIEGNTTYWD